jgi:hypothetical protein
MTNDWLNGLYHTAIMPNNQQTHKQTNQLARGQNGGAFMTMLTDFLFSPVISTAKALTWAVMRL